MAKIVLYTLLGAAVLFGAYDLVAPWFDSGEPPQSAGTGSKEKDKKETPDLSMPKAAKKDRKDSPWDVPPEEKKADTPAAGAPAAGAPVIKDASNARITFKSEPAPQASPKAAAAQEQLQNLDPKDPKGGFDK